MKGATKGTKSIVEFEDNTIAIDIDADGVTERDGWKLLPLNPPVVITHCDCVSYTYCFPLHTPIHVSDT